MLGNRLGWCIALLLAVGFAFAFREAAAINRPTPPTGMLAGASATDVLDTEIPASAVLAFDTPGDARGLYQRAIDAVLADVRQYESLEQGRDADLIERAAAVQALLAARTRAGDALPDPTDRVTYDPPGEEFEALLLAGRCAGRAAALRAAASPDRARPMYEAQFALGAKLMAGRVRLTEMTAGLAMARDAVAGLRDLADREDDPRRRALLATFDRSLAGLEMRRIRPVATAVASVDGNEIARSTGDVYALAGPATRERMWRVEAILALGRHRYAADRTADRLAVPRRLDELERREKDAAVLAAIKAARALTVEQFRVLR